VEDNIRELTVHRSLDQLLHQVDLVDICTTTRGRMDAAVAALEQGVHSMGEKPMARNWIEADRAARRFAERPEVFFQLNDDNAFAPNYMAVRDLLNEGVIGTPQSIWIIRGSRLDSTTVLKSQATSESNGGGCLMDYGAHGLAGLWAVLGPDWRFVQVEAVDIGVRFPERVLEGEPFLMEVEDNAQFKVRMENSRTGSWLTIFMEATWCGGHIGPRGLRSDVAGCGLFRIEGDAGMMDATQTDRIAVTDWDGEEHVHRLPEYPGETVSFNDEIETMVECVCSGTPPEIDIRFGAEIIAVCGAAYYSAIERRAVSIDEFKEFCGTYVSHYGDGEASTLALLKDLMAPYVQGGTGR
jgi:predicted dehydrogenase